MSKIRVQFCGKVAPAEPVHFPARQGENERRPISSAHFTLDVNGYPVVSPNGQGAPCCVVYPKKYITKVQGVGMGQLTKGSVVDTEMPYR